MELIYKKVKKTDEVQLRNLIHTVVSSLEKPEFFIPYADWELSSLFDESYALLHGAYDADTLAGIAQLYCDQKLIFEYIEKLGLTGKKVCELGGILVLPEYRGKGIMYNLIKIQSELAQEKDYDCAISMAHPDNIGSIKALEKLGMQYVKTDIVNDNYLRNIYILNF